MIEDYKKDTIKFYDVYPDEFEEHVEKSKHIVEKHADIFLAELKDKKILDMGAGTGTFAKYLQDKGADVTCLDLSEEMLKKCKEKGLKTIKMDFEQLDFEEFSFDGVWASASILHIPKSRLQNTIKDIKKILKPHAILYLALKREEDNEDHYKDPHKILSKRFLATYSPEEIKKYFSDFEIIKSWEGPKWLNYIMRKKENKN